MKIKIKDGDLSKEFKCTCNFCGCEFKYQPLDINFNDTGALYVQCPECSLPNPPLPQERTLSAPVTVSPEMMKAILGSGKVPGPGGLMV